jgi:hypothetical protein
MNQKTKLQDMKKENKKEINFPVFLLTPWLFIRESAPESLPQQTWDLLAVQQKDSLRFFHPQAIWSEHSKGSSSV